MAVGSGSSVQIYGLRDEGTKLTATETPLCLTGPKFVTLIAVESGRLFGLAEKEIKLKEIVFSGNDSGLLPSIWPKEALRPKAPVEPESRAKGFLMGRIRKIGSALSTYPEILAQQYAFDETKGILYQFISYKKRKAAIKEYIKQAIFVYVVMGLEDRFVYRLRIKMASLWSRVNSIVYERFLVNLGSGNMAVTGIAAIRRSDSASADLRVFFENGCSADIQINRKMAPSDVREALGVQKFQFNPLAGDYQVVDVQTPQSDFLQPIFTRIGTVDLADMRRNEIQSLPKALAFSVHKPIDGIRETIQSFAFRINFVSDNHSPTLTSVGSTCQFFVTEETPEAILIKPGVQLIEETLLRFLVSTSDTTPASLKHLPPESQFLAAAPRKILLIGERTYEDTQIGFVGSNPAVQQVFFPPVGFYALSQKRCREFVSLRPVDRTFTYLCFLEAVDNRVSRRFEEVKALLEMQSETQQIEVATNLLQIYLQYNESYYLSLPLLAECCALKNEPIQTLFGILGDRGKRVPAHFLTDPQRCLEFMAGAEAEGDDCYAVVQSNRSLDAYITFVLDQIALTTHSAKPFSILECALMTYFTKLIAPLYHQNIFFQDSLSEQLVIPRFSAKELQMVHTRLQQLDFYLERVKVTPLVDRQSPSLLTWKENFQILVGKALQLVRIFLLIFNDNTIFDVFMETDREGLIYACFRDHLMGGYRTVEFWNQVLCEFALKQRRSDQVLNSDLADLRFYFKPADVTYVAIMDEMETKTAIEEGTVDARPLEGDPSRDWGNQATLSTQSTLGSIFNPARQSGADRWRLEGDRRFSQASQLCRKSLVNKVGVRPSAVRVAFSEETQALANLAGQLTLTNIEAILPYFVHSRNLRDYIYIVKGYLMAQKAAKKTSKSPQQFEEFRQRISAGRELVLRILFEVQHRMVNYSRLEKVAESTYEFLAEMNLISKMTRLKIKKFFGKVFNSKSKLTLKKSTLSKLSFYGPKELEQTFDACLDVAIQVSDRKLNQSILSFLMDQNLVHRCTSLNDFSAQTILKAFDVLFKSVKHAQYFSHLVINETADPQLRFDIYYRLATIRTKEGDGLGLSDQLRYLETALDVLKSQETFRPPKEWESLPGLILRLKLAELALTEYRSFIETMPDRQRLLQDFPNEVQSASIFEFSMRKQGFDSRFVVNISAKVDLNMTVLAAILAGLVEEGDTREVSEAIRKVASQYLEGDRLTGSQLFVDLFDRLIKMVPKIRKNIWEGLLENLCRFGAHNTIVETVLTNMTAYLGVLEEKTGQLDVAVFRDFPDLTTVDLVWVNKWLVDHVGQGLSSTLTYYHNLLREINWPDQTRFEGSFMVMNVLAFLELTTNRFENYFDSKPLDDLFDADIRTDIFFFRENGFLVDALLEWAANALEAMDPGDPDDPLQQSLRSYLANVTERYQACRERMDKPGWTRKF